MNDDPDWPEDGEAGKSAPVDKPNAKGGSGGEKSDDGAGGMTTGAAASGGRGGAGGDAADTGGAGGSGGKGGGKAGASGSSAGKGGDDDASGNGGAGGAGGAAGKPVASGPCAGMENQFVCQGAMLIACDADGNSGPTTPCMSAAHCLAGMNIGECGECKPGEVKCVEAELHECSPDGKFMVKDTCASAALCDADAHICTDKGCEANSFDCTADGELRRCKPDLTGFERVESCGAGLCNKAKGMCLDCMPNSRMCANSTTLAVCSAQGTGPMQQRCSGSTPACVDTACVQCTSDAMCPTLDECSPQRCDLTSHRCVAGPVKPRGSTCRGGNVCNALGLCVQCVDNADCMDTDPKAVCSLLNTCMRQQGLVEFSGSSGRYTGKLNPGYSLTISATYEAADPSATVTRVTVGSTTTTFSWAGGQAGTPTVSGPTTIPATNQQRSVSITGPSNAACSISGTGSNTVTMTFEDSTVDMDCNEPELTLSAN